MNQWNYFYGALILNSDYKGFLDFVQNKMEDKNYYYFHPALFSQAIQEFPYYYDDILISFGRTAKWFLETEDELNEFIQEFEDLLLHMDFRYAQMKTGGIYCDHSFFWLHKKKLINTPGSSFQTTMEYMDDNKIRFFESEHFYFGLGEISLSTGWCEKSYDEEDLQSFDLQYPGFKYPFDNK